MLVLTNCLSDTPDEGCLKVANSLVSQLKQHGNVLVASYERHTHLADIQLETNKLLFSPKLAQLVWKHRKSLMYIPFPARALSNALRVFMLSLYSGRRVHVLFTMQAPENKLTRLIYRLCRTSFVVLSQQSADFYTRLVGEKNVTYLRTGVDLKRFSPVSAEKRRSLKQIYGFDPDRKIILHAGHLKKGRNVAQLLKIDPRHQVILVASTLTRTEQDSDLREQLLAAPNIHIIDTYLPHIEEIYQMADVYFFPVQDKSFCIDIPLSCLEAAACNLPLVTTHFGAMCEFDGHEGFFFLDDFTPRAINEAIGQALSFPSPHTRDSVISYDWSLSSLALIRRYSSTTYESASKK